MECRGVVLTAVLLILAGGGALCAEVKVAVGHHPPGEATAEFRFEKLPGPSRNDAATEAAFIVIDGGGDRNGGPLDRLHDGKVPTEQDQPAENFFFAAGTEGGRLRIDLGQVIDLAQVNTYSWHPNTRGPQVYTVYLADGDIEGFNPIPQAGVDPGACGWTRIAAVDTRPTQGRDGGQYAVGISDSTGVLGRARYVLFDVSRTEADDPFGNTFYSEIDVVAVGAGAPQPAAPAIEPAGPVQRHTVEIEDGRYRIVIDTTEAPDLTEWARGKLAPVVQEWYPRIVGMLPSEEYQAPTAVTIIFRDMQGVAATSGTRVHCAARWFRGQLKGEAKGAVVHELVHVVQQYGLARRTNRNATRTPGWLVEGIADYIRWFLYEPETRGAEISAAGLSRARYDASYRVSANFINWVVENHDKDLVRKLNAAARQGGYSETLWKEYTGHTVQELNEQWKQSLAERFSGSQG